ncbi:hypothetical protein JYU14_00155 [Simkania negevensis]|uniref:Uncharacterized protein n=1 Tax=Simkania negevensis TaxID=83561 RepID=A0ABS3APB6_9BACT|nr:hypothetical protein [Simkania negevensis]
MNVGPVESKRTVEAVRSLPPRSSSGCADDLQKRFFEIILLVQETLLEQKDFIQGSLKERRLERLERHGDSAGNTRHQANAILVGGIVAGLFNIAAGIAGIKGSQGVSQLLQAGSQLANTGKDFWNTSKQGEATQIQSDLDALRDLLEELKQFRGETDEGRRQYEQALEQFQRAQREALRDMTN